MKRFLDNELVCNERSAKCPEDCVHLHLHMAQEELTLTEAGEEITAPCDTVDAPCPYRLKEAVVKTCVPPYFIAVTNSINE